MKPYIIIDNGHGTDTAGKQSPDGLLREWEWTRHSARLLSGMLTDMNFDNTLLVPEDYDVPLGERCRRANAIAKDHPGAILVSLHSNASGNGSAWGNACGWSAFVAPRASAESRRLASLLHSHAMARGLKGNRSTPPGGYNIASLVICRDTVCPAVLTENMFHDNKEDAAFLLSEEGRRIIAELHASAIRDYAN